MTGGSVGSCVGHGCTTHVQKKRDGCTECDKFAQGGTDAQSCENKNRGANTMYHTFLTYMQCISFKLCIIASDYMTPDDNSKQKDLAFVGYTFKRFESLTKRNAL